MEYSLVRKVKGLIAVVAMVFVFGAVVSGCGGGGSGGSSSSGGISGSAS